MSLVPFVFVAMGSVPFLGLCNGGGCSFVTYSVALTDYGVWAL